MTRGQKSLVNRTVMGLKTRASRAADAAGADVAAAGVVAVEAGRADSRDRMRLKGRRRRDTGMKKWT